MRRSHSIAVALLLFGCASAPEHPGTAPAPNGTRYLSSSDTLYYGFWQQQALYYVRGRDTLRIPGQTFIVRSQEWTDAAEGLRVAQQQQCVGASACRTIDTFTVSPRGDLVAGAPRFRHNVVSLPNRALAVGVQWNDSSSMDSAGIHAEEHQMYHVEKIWVNQGRSLAEIVGDGTMKLHGSFHADSTSTLAQRTFWLEVAGTVRETHWFDIGAGHIVSNFATARLSGWGTMPNGNGGLDTLPAGITMDLKDRTISSERAHMLARGMPGRDSSVTTNQTGVLFVHTMQRVGDEIDAGIARPDGWVRTATERFAGGRPASYDAVWSDTSVRCCTERHVERHGDSLLVRRDGRDTTIAIPAVTWAIGDAMNQEMLVPVLLTIPRDNVTHPFAVYRPYDGKWTIWQTTIRETEGVYVVRMMTSPQDPEEILVVSKSGELLFAEQPKAQQPWTRMPPRGTVRRAALDGLLKRLTPARNVALRAN
ncbi:MAG TPA: hypothetical protein VFA43_16460 [Gemmatimonadaceae bacterium]|nr:hypothetical protein [Gemmatimonadaceae bacterium]